jgi:hypothetical protein
MRKIFLFSILILILLFSGACKSKPETNVPPTTNTIPPTTTPNNTTTTTPNTSSGNTAGNASSSTANRHSSGIILDGAVNYSVVRGDTLTVIARKVYHDGSLYPLIMMVSGIVADPDAILPQMRLTVPALNVNMDDPTAKQSINSYFLQIADIEDRRGRHGTATLIRNHTK